MYNLLGPTTWYYLHVRLLCFYIRKSIKYHKILNNIWNPWSIDSHFFLHFHHSWNSISHTRLLQFVFAFSMNYEVDYDRIYFLVIQSHNTLSIANCYTLKKGIFPLDQCIGFTNAHAQFLCSVSLLKDCSLYWWYLGRGYFSTDKFLYFLKSKNTATSILMHIDPT